MRRAKYRRESQHSKWFSGRRRIIAVVATLVAFGGIVTVTQISDASTRSTRRALSACDRIEAPRMTRLSTQTRRGTYTTNHGTVTQHPDDGAGDVPTAAEMRQRCRDWVMQNVGNNTGGQTQPPASASVQAGDPSASATTPPTQATTPPAGGATPPPGAGLGVLTNSCDTSTLPPHDGFQKGDRCVSTEFGEVGSAANNPSLLITSAPRSVAVNTAFQLKVSTRNLIRDRFLAAGQGGYYVESSVLQDGIVRGHFHTACRMLASRTEAPVPDPVRIQVRAGESGSGGAVPAPTATSGPTPSATSGPTPSATSGPTPSATSTPTPPATSEPAPPAKPQPITKSTVTRSSTTAPAAPAGAGTQTASRGSNDAAP